RFNVDSAWEKPHARIAGEDGKIIEMNASKPASRKWNFSMPVRLAASLLLLAILGVAVVTSTGKLQRITVASTNSENNRIIDLPDGSRVYLNAGTKLSYSKKFGKNSRDISLTGEAYFEVTPDKSKPFRIFAGNACVRVVGTAFNVNTRKSSGIVEVYVESGIVELSENGHQDNNVMLHPGNIGMIDHKSIIRSQAKNANPIAWKTGAMTFSDTPLVEVIALLNNVYNVTIRVEGEGMDTIKINGSYQNDPLEDILRVIGEHNPQLTIAKSDDTIYLSQ
ncbi:MAG TPA: FecR domain-containing protein, partial [Bacteroidales bacterium]|nr:FecR domain-containing protein [Bacteroidales bacterium]